MNNQGGQWGDDWLPLRKLVTEQQGSKQKNISHKLKTTSECRARICKFVEEVQAECGSQEKAINFVKNLMIKFGSENNLYFLYKLSEYIEKL